MTWANKLRAMAVAPGDVHTAAPGAPAGSVTMPTIATAPAASPTPQPAGRAGLGGLTASPAFICPPHNRSSGRMVSTVSGIAG